MMFAKICFAALVLAVGSLFAFSARADERSAYDHVTQTQTIRCAYLVYPPFISMDVNTKKLSGLTVDTMEAIAKELDYKLEWTEEVSMTTAFEAVNLNRFDMLCIPFWLTTPRLKVATPSVPLYYDGYFAFVRKGDKRFASGYTTINNENVKIAIQEGAAIQHILPEYFPKAQVLEEQAITAPTLQLMDVMTKKADVAFVEMTTFKDFEKTNPGQVELALTKPLMVMPATLWVPNGDLRLKTLLDNTITILQSNGTMNKLLDQYGGRKIFSYVRSPYDPVEK